MVRRHRVGQFVSCGSKAKIATEQSVAMANLDVFNPGQGEANEVHMLLVEVELTGGGEEIGLTHAATVALEKFGQCVGLGRARFIARDVAIDQAHQVEIAVRTGQLADDSEVDGQLVYVMQ